MQFLGNAIPLPGTNLQTEEKENELKEEASHNDHCLELKNKANGVDMQIDKLTRIKIGGNTNKVAQERI